MDQLHLDHYPEITPEDFETLFLPENKGLYHNLGHAITLIIPVEICRNKVGLNSYPSSPASLNDRLNIAITILNESIFKTTKYIIPDLIGMIWFQIDPNMNRLLSWLSSFPTLQSLISGDIVNVWTNRDDLEFPVLVDQDYPDFLVEYQKRFPYIKVYYTDGQPGNTPDRQGLSEIGSNRFRPVTQPGNTSELVMENTITGTIRVIMNSYLTRRAFEEPDRSTLILNNSIKIAGIQRRKSEPIDIPDMLNKLKILNYFPDLDVNLFTMCFISKTRTWNSELYKQRYGIYLRFQNYELLEYYGDRIMNLALTIFFYRIGQKPDSVTLNLLSNRLLISYGEQIGICSPGSGKSCADILEAIFGLLYYQYGLVQMDRIIHYMINLQPIWEVVNSKITKTDLSKLELIYQIKYPGTQFTVELVYRDVYRYVMYNLQTGDRRILGYGNQNELGNQDSSGKLYKVLDDLLG